ncbi:hypothetical protein AYO37_00060 [Opitutia bacterium SCGC AG-212-L18]|nr:hypothetical protein AYO37_00060 [Opitutae bacterium SCGC AG-212-L18]
MEILEAFEQKPHDLNELLSIIIEKTKSFTRAQRVIIYLYDDHEKILWNRAGEGIEFMAAEFKLGQGIPGMVMENAHVINIEDVSKDSRFNPAIDDVADVHMTSVLCVPIIEKPKKIGVIELINKQGGKFDEADEAFVEAMCAQAAIAIENTMLFSNLQETRKHEQALAEQIKAQNEKLQEAFMKSEEENKEVKETSKFQKRNWIIAAVAVIALFLAIGLIVWGTGLISTERAPSNVSASEQLGITEEELANKSYYTVEPQPLNYSLTLRGILEPSSIENMFVPFSGRVISKNFTIGEEVAKGQELLVLNDEKVKVEYRNAKIAEITARQEYDKKKNWATGHDLIDAKKAVIRDQGKLDSNKKLYELGVIPKDTLDSAEETLHNAKIKLETTEKEGDEEALQIAEFKWQNAELTEKEFSEKLEKSTIRANTDGVAVLPMSSGSGGDTKKNVTIEVGMMVDDGTVFVSIADLTRLKVVGRVEEVDITSIKQGQSVNVTGDAFPGIVIEGSVTYVSSQAKQGGRAPYFEIYVETLPLTEEQRKRIRLGMSAILSIVTYSNPAALMIPFNTIKIARDGNYVFKQVPGQAEPEKVRVSTGKTTSKNVEITSGIEAGDKLLIL